MNKNHAKFVRKTCLSVLISGAVSCLAMSAQAFTHPCIPATSEDLAYIKANLSQQPWKQGYAILASDGHSSLNYTMQGPFGTVTRNPDLNLSQWRNDMTAVWDLSRMWYFTGNTNYAQKAHDILIAWANTQTNFGGQESGLDLGDYAHCYAGGADILRGTWPGWTAADTATVKNYFLNVFWPAVSAGGNTPGEFNKGLLNMEAGIAIAVFLDDTNKFNHVVDLYRTYPAAGPFNMLPTGETGETGRDEGHVQAGMLGAAFISEVTWKQGIDLYSDLDNRLLAVGEYYARNTLTLDNPFVPYGTVDYTYYADNAYAYAANRSALYLIQNAYKNRHGIPTPWIDTKLQQQNVDGDNFIYARTSDYTTATPQTAVVRPAVSLASSGLTLTTLGNNSAGRSAAYANGIWTVTGLGNGVWTDTGGSDDCQFDYRAMTGDCAMVAQVTSCTYSGSQNGKAGLMIRDNLSPTVSQRAWISITPTSTGTNLVESYQSGWTETWGGIGWERRSNPLPPELPYWLKIERRGNLITTYSSQDGTSWSPIVSSYYGNLPSTIYIGLFICSGNTTANTATFADVAFTGGSGGMVTIPPAPAAAFADGSSEAITVRWLPSFGATAYNLLRSTTSGSGYAVIASNLFSTTTSYVDTSAAAGKTYYYVVQAVNSAGTSGNSPQFYGSRLPAAMANIAFSGTATASTYTQPIEAPDKAFDTDPGSKWFATAATGWLQYDFGANNAQVIKRYTVSSADVATRDPKDWTFLGSQDGSTWITLDSQNGQLFANRMQQNAYNIGNTTAYRYYRLNITADNGATAVALAELGLWSDSGRTIPDGRYQFVSRNSRKVMDVSGGSIAAGAQLVQWSYNGGNSQLWDIAWQGNGRYSATGVASANVIDNGGTANRGANLTIQSWNGGTSQLWQILPDSDGFYQIISANSGLNVDVSGASTADGANIIQWTHNGNYNQQWMPSFAGAGTIGSPVDQWNFDETSGTTAADSVGAAPGTLAAGAGWAAGRINNAVSLNGTSTSYDSFPTGFVSTLGDFSITGWFKLNSVSTWTRIFDFGTGTSVNMFLTPSDGATIRFAITTGGGAGEQRINGTSIPSTGMWHHFAVTLSGAVGVLYIDGVEVGRNNNMTLNPSSLGNTTQNYIGKSQYASDPYLNGFVDDVQIYNYGLSAPEVSNLFNNP
ncbi:MAG TPA: RICIN domain-containing protein [Verrucomicrobiae bacterium]|nr:RICIN domain-containing protein [Verrucomicrobiae bacterium]